MDNFKFNSLSISVYMVCGVRPQGGLGQAVDNNERQVDCLTHLLEMMESPFGSKAGSGQVFLLVKQFWLQYDKWAGGRGIKSHKAAVAASTSEDADQSRGSKEKKATEQKTLNSCTSAAMRSANENMMPLQ